MGWAWRWTTRCKQRELIQAFGPRQLGSANVHKTILRASDGSARELNRLDIKNHRVVPKQVEDETIERLYNILPSADAVIVVDQVEENNCGVIYGTRKVSRWAKLPPNFRQRSLPPNRDHIGEFQNVILKPNTRELLTAFGVADEVTFQTFRELFQHPGRTVFLAAKRAFSSWIQKTERWFLRFL